MLVGKPVNNSLIRIEFVGDDVEVPRVAGLISSKDRIGHVIRELNEPRCPGVDEQWGVY